MKITNRKLTIRNKIEQRICEFKFVVKVYLTRILKAKKIINMKKFNNGQKVQHKEKGVGRIVDGYDLDGNSVYQVKWLDTNTIEKFLSEKDLKSFDVECKTQSFFNKIFRSGKSGKIVKVISFVIFVYLLVLLILTIK